MHFLVDENLPRSVVERLKGLGHEAHHVCELGLGGATDERIAERARTTGTAIITRDFDFADIRHYPPEKYAGILVIFVPDDAPASVVLTVLMRFVERAEFVAGLPGRLAILEQQRVRFRPPLPSGS